MDFLNITSNKLFGNFFEYFDTISANILEEISNNTHSYAYLDVDYYGYMSQIKGVTWSMNIYWSEMLQRVYLAASTGFLRLYSWLEGIEYAMASTNIILFASTVRGFIESSCDLYDALENVSLTIAENHSIIAQAVSNQLNSMCISEELENTLIHFQNASNSNNAQNDSVHMPKSAKKYLTSRNLTSLNLYACYSKLCEITHPAEDSLSVFLKNCGNLYSIQTDTSDQITSFINSYSAPLAELFQRTFNVIILLFKTVNKFKIKQFTLKYADNLNCDSIIAWQKIDSLFNE